MNARLEVAGSAVRIDLARSFDLSVELDFQGPQVRHFGAPRADSRPFSTADFPGTVARGASCNCEAITLIPHCHGTHTECVGHLTRERMHAQRIVPRELPLEPRALVVRTLPNESDKRTRDYTALTPPYLTREAAHHLIERGIEHLVVDLPSIDRTHDEGRLTAHRLFFGLPPGNRALARALRPQCTVTELAYVPDEAADGPYLLQLQVPAINGDAVPSRPLLYRLS